MGDDREVKSRPSGGRDDRPDAETLGQVKDILTVFAHTISAMKLFPAFHSSVLSFQDELFDKLCAFLERHWELEVRVEENAFRYKDELAYQDADILKSLPYVFFKDGLMELAFLRDLEKDELEIFLETVRRIALLPPEEGDIVDALWEKDLAHVRYYAPDEFLESKIAARRKERLAPEVDRKNLFQGRIELTAEDLEDISKRLLVFRQKENREAKEFIGLAAHLDRGDRFDIETMLDSERGVTLEKGLSELIFELLYMEDRLEAFKNILSFLDKRFAELVQKMEFAEALRLMGQMEDLDQALSDTSPARAVEIDRFIQTARSRVSLDGLRDQLRRGVIQDAKVFFEFLRWLGPETLPVAAEIIEGDLDPSLRSGAFDFLVDTGRENLALLTRLAQERKPFISKTIIAALDRMNDKSVIPFLAAFINYRNRDVKAKAIQALGRFSDSRAQKILIGFLRDAEEEIRIEAVKQIRPDLGRDLTASLVQWVGAKEFHAKSPQEKEAALQALARIGTDDALEGFRALLGQKGIRGKHKEETAVLAVDALVAAGSPRAVEIILLCAAKFRRGRVQDACQAALARLAAVSTKKDRT